MFKKLFQASKGQKQQDRLAELYSNLIRHEARIGGELFGPVGHDGRREFFCLDKHTWIWHEEWIDFAGERQVRTTRYDIRPDGILKAQNGQHYQKVDEVEAQRLRQAAKMYFDRVRQELYSSVA